ncbi:glycoside hydrolase family 2 protein [Ponticoccus sp. SC2-23]|uniref:beta-mannosidase n=1 Tax=Alexandriicola marinus TaxID=2081710 RepID=UPI000FDC3A36|nr:glycoside hydrolase family 2 protein [Alexandriicola marinus]MBM1220586.1 glycoside hydrolase family 2 protein [Ponticoccus sp. SC6-9]MBM1225272.1 glycoside hydrolase family 2 protein [Ponticoccus sp. SC6-15]MBM1228786.1 glycoside hydrolase family 2 protein [Ponticoccus sp. SC6-38]MBM1233577.1 glycoside hydrolase family 2 protein [Ponticoccus sp. SC6-45]MBM1239287.1 glycoside hydrolase family 2 protein [Ponticoccus sp. SC6-49]MBM1243069.1 glycoside hydrolase family 2 protein [Ponticoccus s
MTQADLTGVWSLRDAQGTHSCDFALPGDGITALHQAGLIPDPYWGRNEYDLRWICEQDWIATRSFEIEDDDVVLVLSQVDTVATVSVNGTEVAQLENAFRSYRISLAGIARTGRNEIAITFHSPVEAGRKKQDAHPFEIPWSTNCPIPFGNFLRKPACDFGWDWNIALAPFGIYGDIRIEKAGADRIARLEIAQRHDAGTVTLDLVAQMEGTATEARFEIADQVASASVDGGIARARITITDPKLWWPAGQGDQPLYDLTVSAGTAKAHRRIGLRRLDLITEPDEAGLGFKFRVNGRDVFAKGANWIPAEALPGQITQEGVAALLKSAVDANMNMIRIWGGGRYEPSWFYDLCDEMGLMVWQDFMFACNLYPSDPAFLNEVTAEVEENVARLHHHACLALWCGDNELIGALTWYDVSRKDRDRYLVNYDRLNRTVELALRRTDPHANWWPSSPSPGPLSFGDAWHDDGSGDMHFWSVWHEGRDFEHYRDVSPRFCSEFGFQSYPSMEAIRRFAGPEDFNIAAPVLESHQKNAGGNARIAETMFRYFRWPEKFEDFVWLSQLQQGLAIKTAVQHWRGLRPHCMGTLIWQLNDTWPVCSWSSLDHGGGWKLMHYMARDFYRPVAVIPVPGETGIELRAVNDGPREEQLKVTAFAADMKGTARQLAEADVTVAGSAVTALTVPESALGDQEMLTFVWTDSSGQMAGDVFAPRPYKTYDLEAPNLSHTAEKSGDIWKLTIRTEALAHFVTAEADCPGRFSLNGFALFPGHPAEITFVAQDPTDTPSFILRDLYNATMATTEGRPRS